MMTVGYRALEVPDATQGVTIPVHLLYPASASAREEMFGPYPITIARDAPISTRPSGDRPLVVVSHGTGGSPWPYRGLAAHLAGAGYEVALVEHPGNRRGDDALAHTPANLINRPRHLHLVLDALGASRAAIVGHSLGGYTGLALAGGQPYTLPHETGTAQPLEVVHDARVAALVLLAPAVPWLLAEGALRGVTAPILVRMGERDPMVPAWTLDGLTRGVADPARVDGQLVANAGHFSFQSPFPPAMQRPDFPPSQDPPGFDRAAYQPILHAEIERFLATTFA